MRENMKERDVTEAGRRKSGKRSFVRDIRMHYISTGALHKH